MAESRTCPCCGSTRTASRRQLFHWLMGQGRAPGPFTWYNERVPQALPPASLAVLPALLLLGMSLPMAGFWLLGHSMALKSLAVMALVVLLALLIDVLSTYQRYRLWGRQWLCAECREAFTIGAISAA